MAAFEKAMKATGEDIAIFLTDGEWEIMIGNPFPYVRLGEVEGRYRSRNKSLGKAIKEAMEMLERERAVAACFAKHKDILQPAVDCANEAIKGLGKW